MTHRLHPVLVLVLTLALLFGPVPPRVTAVGFAPAPSFLPETPSASPEGVQTPAGLAPQKRIAAPLAAPPGAPLALPTEPFLAQAIATGDWHTCALTTTGAVWCWGYNDYGQIGDGSTGGNKTTPVLVSNLPSDVTAIAAGAYHTCALTTTGAVWCWGRNNYGQLGDGSTGGNKTTPVLVSGLPGGVIAIAAGLRHTCALTTTGAVWCWGDNQYGQLGDGSNDNQDTPVQVSPPPATSSLSPRGASTTAPSLPPAPSGAGETTSTARSATVRTTTKTPRCR